jgi:curved DNA-binding protein CbpA
VASPPKPAAPAPKAPVAAAPPPAAAAKPPAAPVDPAAELKELQERAAKIKDQNLFEILGLTEKTDAAAVKAAYFKLAKAYHPDTVQPNQPPEYSKLKADIFAAVGDAYRKLSDDKARAQYIEDLKTGGSEQVDIQQILMAEELFQKGQIMVKAKKFADAVKMLDDAIKANPEEGEFYAWRGNAKFFAIADRNAGFAEATKDLTLALKKNPRCAHAYFVQGTMAKLLGDNSGALRNFQKTVELQPNHTDAQRELRMQKK